MHRKHRRCKSLQPTCTESSLLLTTAKWCCTAFLTLGQEPAAPWLRLGDSETLWPKPTPLGERLPAAKCGLLAFGRGDLREQTQQGFKSDFVKLLNGGLCEGGSSETCQWSVL